MDRKKELRSFAAKLRQIEDKYNVKVISDNGFTKAMVIDLTTGHCYDYHNNGKLSYNENNLDENPDEYL